MLPDKSLRQPPEVEDQSVLRYSSGTAASWQEIPCQLAAAMCIPLVSLHCAVTVLSTKCLQHT